MIHSKGDLTNCALSAPIWEILLHKYFGLCKQITHKSKITYGDVHVSRKGFLTTDWLKRTRGKLFSSPVHWFWRKTRKRMNQINEFEPGTVKTIRRRECRKRQLHRLRLMVMTEQQAHQAVPPHMYAEAPQLLTTAPASPDQFTEIAKTKPGCTCLCIRISDKTVAYGGQSVWWIK